MRSTIVFLALLVLMSCSTAKIDSYDTALLELAADPSAEAIFATIAIQLKADSNEGFDRVLGLLNDLVDDGKKQLHNSNKIWRFTNSRCEVSQMKFQERQNYYETREKAISEAADEAGVQGASASDNSVFMGSSSKFIESFRDSENALHAEAQKALEEKVSSAKAAIENADNAIKAVQEWNAKGTAFVQKALEKVANSYLELNTFKIVIPPAFVEMAASDEQVKTRLLEWLTSLRVSFFDIHNDSESRLSRRKELWGKISNAVQDLLSTYTADITYNNAQVGTFTESQSALRESATLLKKLAADNSQLVAANAEYCKVERNEYEKVKAILENQLKVFQDIREYFRTNYSKLSNFVKSKYSTFTK